MYPLYGDIAIIEFAGCRVLIGVGETRKNKGHLADCHIHMLRTSLLLTTL